MNRGPLGSIDPNSIRETELDTECRRRRERESLNSRQHDRERDATRQRAAATRRRETYEHEHMSARHLSACLLHVSASGAIIAAATAYSRRLTQQNPYKTCVLLVELGRTSRHFIVHVEKIPTKSSPAGIGVGMIL